MIQTPNKIYCIEYKGDHAKFGGTYHSHFVIVVASSSIDVVRQYVKEKIGIDEVPIWLMGATYPTIWNQDGSVPLQVQAQILYNGNHHVHLKDKDADHYVVLVRDNVVGASSVLEEAEEVYNKHEKIHVRNGRRARFAPALYNLVKKAKS